MQVVKWQISQTPASAGIPTHFAQSRAVSPLLGSNSWAPSSSALRRLWWSHFWPLWSDCVSSGVPIWQIYFDMRIWKWMSSKARKKGQIWQLFVCCTADFCPRRPVNLVPHEWWTEKRFPNPISYNSPSAESDGEPRTVRDGPPPWPPQGDERSGPEASAASDLLEWKKVNL